VRNIRDELKEGQQILVKCLNVEANKIRLSRRAVLRDEKAASGEGNGNTEQAEGGNDRSERPERNEERGERGEHPRGERGERGDRGDRGGHDRRNQPARGGRR
jgi:polyribonucleotide nucleotidyltransferase